MKIPFLQATRSDIVDALTAPYDGRTADAIEIRKLCSAIETVKTPQSVLGNDAELNI